MSMVSPGAPPGAYGPPHGNYAAPMRNGFNPLGAPNVPHHELDHHNSPNYPQHGMVDPNAPNMMKNMFTNA
jgi:hypothetical protein